MTESVASQSRPVSRLNRPVQELVLAARRERGLLLRAMIVSAARRVMLVFAGHRQQLNGVAAKSQRG